MVRQIGARTHISEAHCGGWEGLGEEGWEPAQWLTIFLIFNYHGFGNGIKKYRKIDGGKEYGLLYPEGDKEWSLTLNF